MVIYIDCGILRHIFFFFDCLRWLFILFVAFYGIGLSHLLMVQDGYIYIDCGILWHMLVSSFDGSGRLYIYCGILWHMLVSFYGSGRLYIYIDCGILWHMLVSSFDGSGRLYIY